MLSVERHENEIALSLQRGTYVTYPGAEQHSFPAPWVQTRLDVRWEKHAHVTRMSTTTASRKALFAASTGTGAYV